MPDSPDPVPRPRGRPRIHPLPDPNAPKRPRGRPRKEPVTEAVIVAKRPRGRPRIHPLPDPNAPKRPRGRPRKEDANSVARASSPAADAPPPTRKETRKETRPATERPASRARLGANNAVPPRVTLARIYKMDAYFRDLFHDRNPERRYPNYTELGKLFGVDADTSKRDIIVMQDRFELPLDEFKERGGWGYYELPPRLSGIWMQPGELLIVAASWGALEGRRGSGSEIGPKVRTAMEKLMNVVGADLAFDFQTVSERIAFRSSGYQSAIDIATFETVTAAVLSQHELGFTYRKQARRADAPRPQPEMRYVQPRCMVCVDHSAWYILADDPARPEEEPHTFALFRMSEVIDTGRKFEPTRPFDIEETLRHSLGIDRSGEVSTVELLFDPEVAGYVEEHFWHSTQQFGTADDGRLLLTMKVAVNPELEGKIRKWTPYVEVLNPPELRETFKKHAAKEYARYH